jgi:hypothetical protein
LNQGGNEGESDSVVSEKDLTQSGNSTTESGKTHSADESDVRLGAQWLLVRVEKAQMRVEEPHP